MDQELPCLWLLGCQRHVWTLILAKDIVCRRYPHSLSFLRQLFLLRVVANLSAPWLPIYTARPRFYCARSNGTELVPIIRSSGVSAIQGFSCIEVYGEAIWTFKIMSWVSAIEGCLLSGVPLYVCVWWPLYATGRNENSGGQLLSQWPFIFTLLLGVIS